jgi:hypothetical protein
MAWKFLTPNELVEIEIKNKISKVLEKKIEINEMKIYEKLNIKLNIWITQTIFDHL